MGKKILLVDDSDFILESTATLLMFEGYEVVTASNGQMGIDSAVKEIPDMIICDVSMPGLSGYDVVTAIRANEITANIPFVFLTAFTEKSKMREGMERGANDYLTKPFTKKELIAAVNSQLKMANQVETKIASKIEIVGKKLNYALPHEFRTVLSQLLGNANSLKSNIDALEKQDIIEIADEMILVVRRLNRITDNFLLFNKLESYTNSPKSIEILKQAKTVEPVMMINDIAETVSSKFNRLGDIELIDPIFEITLAIGSDLFTKLIDELLDNACKFSSAGTKIDVTSKVENDELIVSIKDNGIGMSAEQLKSIGAFEQFQREEYEQQGVGIGLSIARKIVELHGGKNDMKSEKDVGTTVTFKLPLCK